MHQKQENYFVVIPYPVLTDPDLSDVDKLVYGEISALTNKEGYCYASNKHIGEVLNKSAMTARRSIYKLRELGYIRVDNFTEEKENTVRKIYLDLQKLNRGMFKNEHPPMSKMNTKNINKDHKLDKLATPKTDKSVENVDKPVDNSLQSMARKSYNNIQRKTNGMLPIGDILTDQQSMLPDPVDKNDPVKTAHQAYGLEAVDQLQLPSKYKARIIGSCKDMPLHRIENAVEATMKNAVKLKDAEQRARYFFKVLYSNG